MKPGDIVTWSEDLSPGRLQCLERDYGPGPYVLLEASNIYRDNSHWRLYRMCDGEIFQYTSFSRDMLRVCTFLNAARKAIKGRKTAKGKI